MIKVREEGQERGESEGETEQKTEEIVLLGNHDVKTSLTSLKTAAGQSGEGVTRGNIRVQGFQCKVRKLFDDEHITTY